MNTDKFNKLSKIANKYVYYVYHTSDDNIIIICRFSLAPLIKMMRDGEYDGLRNIVPSKDSKIKYKHIRFLEFLCEAQYRIGPPYEILVTSPMLRGFISIKAIAYGEVTANDITTPSKGYTEDKESASFNAKFIPMVGRMIASQIKGKKIKGAVV